ncbi:hypothetical protein AVEN_129385-1 [Araneus ventricosus]|uniref:Uncharacterized protein n=1 Tax=Araneus ventricosus TaxID=182803 RepID=A0A4Y2N6W1_ARAVE|nr:hypothetical protein AVEN_129385-1 [Araneus ventricosus]
MEALRDTGSSVDLISFKNVKESDLTGDYVWARQALTNEHTSLALAEIDLEIHGVRLKTKAAVLDPSVERKHYLLGNKTQELIDAIKKNPYSPELINLVVTRSQTKIARTEREDGFLDSIVGSAVGKGSSTIGGDMCEEERGNNPLNDGREQKFYPQPKWTTILF